MKARQEKLKIKAPNFRGEPRFTTKYGLDRVKKEKGLLFMQDRMELWVHDINIPDGATTNKDAT